MRKMLPSVINQPHPAFKAHFCLLFSKLAVTEPIYLNEVLFSLTEGKKMTARFLHCVQTKVVMYCITESFRSQKILKVDAALIKLFYFLILMA